MITKELREAAKEIDEIFVYLPKEYIEKIPIKLREFFREIEDKEYNAKIDPKKKLDEQEIMEKTKTLLTIIYKDYWCTPEEKEELEKILIENDKEFEKKIRKKYNPDNIFKRKNIDYDDKNTWLVETKKTNFFKRIIEKIKKLLKNKRM